MTDRAKEFDAQGAAQYLLDGHKSREPFKPFADEFGIENLEQAYRVQDLFVGGLGPDGSRAGYKVGLTSKAMQAMVNLDQPIGGVVFSDGVLKSPADLSCGDYGRLGLEFEIAVRLAKDIGADNLPLDIETVGSCVAEVGPAFEIIDDREADYSTLDVFSILADNSWNAGAILGEMKPFEGGDLASVTGTLSVNGEMVGQGTGADVLGHPFEPLVWLAEHLTSRGGRLRAGDIVFTGSLLPSRFPETGDFYEFTISGLGGVTAKIIA